MTAGGTATGSTSGALRPAARVVTVLILVATGAVLAFWVNRAVRTSAQLRPLAGTYHANLEQFRCLTAEVRREVPQGAQVYIGGGYGGQVLSELVVRWVEPAPPGQAAWRLSLEHTGPCAGEQIRASRA